MAYGLRRILLLVAVLAGCNSEPPPAPDIPAVTDLGVIPWPPGVNGRDGGSSTRVGNRSIWIYGDTTVDRPGVDGRQWRHNSVSWSADFWAFDGISDWGQITDELGVPAELMPQTADERTFNDLHFIDGCTTEPCGARWATWPGSPVYDAARKRTLIFYGLIYAEPGAFNFGSVGNSIAVWHDGDAQPERPEFRPGTEHPTLFWIGEVSAFGSASLAVGDMLYAYSCQTGGLSKSCMLGRAPLADALTPSAWRYYAGMDTWSAAVTDAVDVLTGNDILSVAWNEYLGAYIAVYSQPLRDRVLLRTAPAPEGPWSLAVELFETLPREDGIWVYDALLHPEYVLDGGRIQYISYTRGSEMRWVQINLAKALQ